MVVGIRVGMLVVLGDVLELFLAESAIKWPESVSNFRLDGCTFSHNVLSVTGLLSEQVLKTGT